MGFTSALNRVIRMGLVLIFLVLVSYTLMTQTIPLDALNTLLVEVENKLTEGDLGTAQALVVGANALINDALVAECSALEDVKPLLEQVRIVDNIETAEALLLSVQSLIAQCEGDSDKENATETPSIVMPENAISADNVDQLTELIRIGRGQVYDIALIHNGQTLVVFGSIGMWLIDTTTFEFTGFIEQPDAFTITAISPDGSQFASSHEAIIEIRDFQTNELLTTLEGHNRDVNSLSYSPDGTQLASASDDRMIIVWDLETNEILNSVKADDSGLIFTPDLKFSPDGTKLSYVSDRSNIHVISASTLEPLYFFEHEDPGYTSYIHDMAFSPDSTHIAATYYDQKLRVFDVSNGIQLHDIATNNSWVRSIAYSNDGQYAVTAQGSSVHIYDMASGNIIQTLQGINDEVFRTAFFSSDDISVYGLARDHSIRIWDVNSGEPISTLREFSHYIYDVEFSPDGTQLITGSENDPAQIWDATTGELHFSLPTRTASTGVAFSQDGTKIATNSGWVVEIWDVANQGLHESSRLHTSFSDLDFSPDGQFVATMEDGTGAVRIHDVVTGEQILYLEGHAESGSDVAFSPDGTQLASSSNDETIRIWNMPTGEFSRVLSGHDARIRGIDYSNDGQYLISASLDGTIRIWDVQTGNIEMIFEGADEFYDVEFSPDDSLIVASGDQDIRIWDRASGALLTTLHGHTDDVYDIAISPDNTRVASGSRDGTIRIWGIPGE